jgi:hypothetical protein
MRHSLNDDREWVHAVLETFFPGQPQGAAREDGQRESHNPEDGERKA